VAEAAEKLAAMLEKRAGQRQRSSTPSPSQPANRPRPSTKSPTAVRQMDEMTQHNAALVEQTNAAIEQTESQASELDRIVDHITPRPVAGEFPFGPPSGRPQNRERIAIGSKKVTCPAQTGPNG
jgi:hypothetical protein